MDTHTGRWVPEIPEHRDMNQYSIGQVVQIMGDFWEVESIVDKLDGGRLTLRALSKEDRAKLGDQLRKNLLGHPVRNRADRHRADRLADRKLRKLLIGQTNSRTVG